MKLIKSIFALTVAVFLGTSARAAEATEGTKDITLMASETSSAITTTETALKWYVTKDETAQDRLDVKIERLVDSTAKVTITANGTEAGEKVAVLGLYASKGGGDDVLVKTINVTITAKEDKDYLAENTTGTEHSVISEKDAKVIHIGDTWEYTTVTKGSNWTLTRADGTYKSYNLSQNFSKYMYINGSDSLSDTMSLTANADGTVTFSVKGKESAGTKALILSLQNNGVELMKIQIIVDKVVENISMKKGETVRREANYGDTGADRRWVFNNDGTAENVVSLAVKNGETAMGTTGVTLQNHPEFKWQTTSWQQRVNTDLTANKLGNQVVSIARLNGNETSFATMYEYNVHVYDEKETNIVMTAGERFPIVFESEEAGAWEVEGLAEDDETVSMSAYSGWHATSFETEIIANKATKEGEAKTFTVKNNFCVYTVNVTIKKGMEIKNISVAANGEYVDETIEGAKAVLSDDAGIATIERDSDTKVTISGIAVGDTVCVVKDDGGKTNYLYNVTVYSSETKDAFVGLGKTASIDCTSADKGNWTAEVIGEQDVVQIVNDKGESSTEFRLMLKGLKADQTTILVKNAYAQYTINVTVSADFKDIALSLEQGAHVTTNLNWGTAMFWTAEAKSGDKVATVTIGSGEAEAMDAEVEALTAGNAQWTVYVGEAEGEKQYTAYNMNIKVWASNELEAVSMKLGEKKTLALTSAAQDSWTAESSDKNVATVSPATCVTSISFAPVIEAVGEGEATITVKNAYVIYTIKVTVVPAAVTVTIVADEGVDDVQTNGVSVVGELELPADATEVTLTLEANVSLNVPVYKVITNGVDGVKVTNVTTRVATYSIKEGDTLEFFAEEADKTDPDVTDDQIKRAIIDAFDDDVDAVKKANAIVDTSVTPAQNKISARELAAWIDNNGILSSDFGASDYVVASAKLNARMPITDDNTEIEFVNDASVTADGFVFDVSIVIDERKPLELEEDMTNIVASCIQTTDDRSTGFTGETVDVGRVTITEEGKVQIKPTDGVDDACEYFTIVIPKDPGVDTDDDVESSNVIGWSRKASGLTAAKSARQALAVNWSAEDGDISLDALVGKSNFAEGDKIYAYNAAAYDGWELSEGEWKPMNTFKVGVEKAEMSTSAEAAERTVTRGSVVWVERADATEPVYTSGYWGARTDFDTAESEDTPIAVESGMNLVAAANYKKVNLKAEFAEPGEKDRVILPIPGKAPRIYTVVSGAWGYAATEVVNGIAKPVRKTADADVTIPAGCGFWYDKAAEEPAGN